MTERIGILGAGAWGTALATLAAARGRPVAVWARDPDHAARLEQTRENRRDLAGVALPETVRVSAAIEPLHDCDVILAVVPAQAMREALASVAPVLRPGLAIVICAKGFERATGFLLGHVARAVVPACRVAALSGPSFAAEVGRGLPTAVTVAAETRADAAAIAALLGTAAFRIYHTDDLIGVETGGAVKNVLAIACGIAHGRNLGASASAALMARAFAELLRFGQAVGARPETLMGLSGFGDLVLTCGSPQSRNFSLGLALGRGEAGPAGAGHSLTEGVATAPVLVAKARALRVSMPIAECVAAVLDGRMPIDAAIGALMARPASAES